jgi:hypothetical protein
VGIARVVPTDGIGYDPTDGALTAPYPDVPAWATGAATLGMASAAANAIVVIFMGISFSLMRSAFGHKSDRPRIISQGR